MGSYPRPHWFTNRSLGRDIEEVFKLPHHPQDFEDADRTVLMEQGEAGRDIVPDDEMWFDEYGGIGSFIWNWYERLAGFSAQKHEHPPAAVRPGDAGAGKSAVAWKPLALLVAGVAAWRNSSRSCSATPTTGR